MNIREKYLKLVLTLTWLFVTINLSASASSYMPNIIFPLDNRKTIAVAENLLTHLGGKNNYMYLLKLIFFADRFHVRQYLRPATGDRYYAMKQGAVASYLYNVCKGELTSDVIVPTGNYGVVLIGDGGKYKDELSASDIEALNFSLSSFAQYGEFALSKITHAYPEWKKYEEVILSGKSLRQDMYFQDFLLNADPDDKIFKQFNIQDPYIPINEENRKVMEAELLEISNQTA